MLSSPSQRDIWGGMSLSLCAAVGRFVIPSFLDDEVRRLGGQVLVVDLIADGLVVAGIVMLMVDVAVMASPPW